jgi:hypothetical protein
VAPSRTGLLPPTCWRRPTRTPEWAPPSCSSPTSTPTRSTSTPKFVGVLRGREGRVRRAAEHPASPGRHRPTSSSPARCRWRPWWPSRTAPPTGATCARPSRRPGSATTDAAKSTARSTALADGLRQVGLLPTVNVVVSLTDRHHHRRRAGVLTDFSTYLTTPPTTASTSSGSSASTRGGHRPRTGSCPPPGANQAAHAGLRRPRRGDGCTRGSTTPPSRSATLPRGGLRRSDGGPAGPAVADQAGARRPSPGSAAPRCPTPEEHLRSRGIAVAEIDRFGRLWSGTRSPPTCPTSTPGSRRSSGPRTPW